MSCGCRGGLCIGLLPRWGRCVFVWHDNFYFTACASSQTKIPPRISGSHPQDRNATPTRTTTFRTPRADPKQAVLYKMLDSSAFAEPSAAPLLHGRLADQRVLFLGDSTIRYLYLTVVNAASLPDRAAASGCERVSPTPRSLVFGSFVAAAHRPSPSLAAAQGQLAVSSASGMSRRGPRGETITPARRSPTGAIATATDPTRALSTLCAYSRTGTTSWAMELRSTT